MTRNAREPDRCRVRGFTLTEVMVSSALGVVLMGIVLSIMGLGGEGYARTTARVDANVEARAALRTLADDVSASLFDDSFGVRSVVAPRPMSEVWFPVLKPRSAQDSALASGDRCFVYYYTSVTRPLEGVAGPYSRKLYRRLVSSAEVMKKRKAGEDLDSPDPNPVAVADEAVAFNVVQFLVEPLVRSEEGTERQWTEEDGEPSHLRVTLRVTDNRTAGALTGIADWEGKSDLAKQLLAPGEFENKRVRTFRMTIPFAR